MLALIYGLGWLTILVIVWIAARRVVERSHRRLNKYVMWWERRGTNVMRLTYTGTPQSKLQVFGGAQRERGGAGGRNHTPGRT
jgi:type IV secretory pathway VirB3-like protein